VYAGKEKRIMNDLIIKIGPLFWILCLFAVYGLAVVAERVLYFHKNRVNIREFLRGISQLVSHNKIIEAQHESSRLPGPLSNVIPAILSHADLKRDELRGIAEDAVQFEVFNVEKNIRGLLVVATICPLIGVLGTIQGLIGFYAQPGVLDGKTPSLMMSDAVFQALLSSALGLGIAIPAYLFYSYLAFRSRKVIHSLERAGMEVINLVCDARNKGETGISESTPDVQETEGKHVTESEKY
jgi:biopolymer transport protein ExbB